MINLLLISAIICYIIDLSGVVDEFKHFLWKRYIKTGDYHNLSLKPLDCSRCVIWWTGLVYILITGFTLPLLAYVALLSLLSSNISDALILIKDTATYLINALASILE